MANKVGAFTPVVLATLALAAPSSASSSSASAGATSSSSSSSAGYQASSANAQGPSASAAAAAAAPVKAAESAQKMATLVQGLATRVGESASKELMSSGVQVTLELPRYGCDEDGNYFVITTRMSDGIKKPMGLIALAPGGQVGSEAALVQTLVTKAKDYETRIKQKEKYLLLPSGSFIDIEGSPVAIHVDQGGILCVDGRKAALVDKKGNSELVRAEWVRSYTQISVKKEGDLIILSDDYDRAEGSKRGKEGLVFNLARLRKDGTLELYRTRAAASSVAAPQAAVSAGVRYYPPPAFGGWGLQCCRILLPPM